MNKNIKLLILILIYFVSYINSSAETNKIVNVLTWSGYFNHQSAKFIENKCGVILSYDDYTSNDDMLSRWHPEKNKYDILIFSNTIYNAVSKEIFLKNSKLSENSKYYNPTILQKYVKRGYPPNVAYFAHSLTGFIWNPKIVNLSETDTVQSVFKKARNNKVILMDDPVEINMLLTAGNHHVLNSANNEISLSNLKKLIQKSQVFISNEINQIYNQNDFSLSYEWSGEAFNNNTNNYKFLVNPNLSYISTDLIAQVKDDSFVACAANVLASKEFLSKFQVRTNYFSPYGNIELVPEGSYKELYKKFLKELPKLRWLESASVEQLKNLEREWNRVKYELSKDNQ